MKGGISVALDIEEQYDKLYRYCYFKLHHAQTAEDITQESFLRYWERYHPMPTSLAIKHLYIIAKNLCIDEYRKQKNLPLDETIPDAPQEETLLTQIAVQKALSALSSEDQELVFLRYVNEEPIGTIGKILGISRFAVYRKLKSASNRFQIALNKEGFYDSMEK